MGAYLEGLIFMIKYNGVLLRPIIPRQISGPVSETKAKSVKHMDDDEVPVSINLEQCLIEDPELTLSCTGGVFPSIWPALI